MKKRRSQPGPYLIHLKKMPDRIADPLRYPYVLPAIRSLSKLVFHPKVTFLVGENGSGKSTIMEALALACDLNPEGGSRNFNFQTRASHSKLVEGLRLARTTARPGDSYFLRAESYFNLATEIERLDEGGRDIIAAYGGVSLHEQSHGESFFALFRNRFRDHGLYLLDEPEAALSPSRQLQFLAILHEYLERGGQFVIATHSPIIMAYPDATIYHLSPAGLTPINYEDTDHYKITRGFLNSRKSCLAELLARP